MLSNKKKDSTNLYQGIAGKYVKRDTPPILRSKFVWVYNYVFFSTIIPQLNEARDDVIDGITVMTNVICHCFLYKKMLQ